MTAPDPKDGPTQAQLEIGLTSLRNELDYQKRINPFSTATTAIEWAVNQIAALTAAAEAVEPNGEIERLRNIVEQAGITIANLRKEKSATIERCAQVARDTLVRLDYPVPAERVFEAIMALKDQAPHSFEDNPLDWRRP